MRSILTFLSHFFAGVITILSVLVHPVLPIILLFIFTVYEVDEDYHLSDKAFVDIRQFGYGAFLTSLILIILKVKFI